MRKSGFGSVRSLLAASAAFALPLGLASGEPGSPPAPEAVQISADRALARATELTEAGKLVQAERLLHAVIKSSAEGSMPEAESIRMFELMSRITVAMRSMTPSQLSLQKAEADLGSGDLRSAISYANQVMTSPSAPDEEKAAAKAVHDLASAQQADLLPRVREDLFAGVDAFGAGSYEVARDRLTRVVRSGVRLAPGEQSLLDTFTGKLRDMAEATGDVRLGVFGAAEDDEKVDWLLQSQPEGEQDQPATDPIQDSNRAEAMTILAEADRALSQSQFADAERKYSLLLQNYRQYLSADDLARVEQNHQRATLELGGTPPGNVLEQNTATLEQVRGRARSMFDSQMKQAQAALDSGDFARARNAASLAQLTANQNRNYLPEAEFSDKLDQAEEMLRQIAASEETARNAATEAAAADLANQAEARNAEEQAARDRMIDEALGRVRALQMELRYEEALQIVDQILTADPLNPAGLLLKDVLEDAIIYRDYLHVQRDKYMSYAEQSLDNEEALIAPETVIGYPADWPNISFKRGEPMQFSESAANRAVLSAMSEQRIPVNFQDNAFGNVIEFIENISNLNIDVDWGSLELIGVDRETPVTLKLTNVSLETVLDRVLEKVSDPDIPAGWAVTDGILTIASDEVLRRNTVLEIYDIRDLLVDIPDYTEAPTFDLNSVLQSSGGRGGGGQSRSPFQGTGQNTDVTRRDRQEMIDEIVEIISSNVDYEGWLENGGDTGSMREFNGNLIITNTPKNHRSIIALLSKLREVRALQINVEVRFLLVAQDFFEQIGFDLDVYLNADNNEFGIARTLDPSLLPSDYFDDQGNLVRRVGSGNFDLNGDGTIDDVGIPGEGGDFVPVFAPGTQGDEFSIIRGAQNSFSLTNLLAAGSSFAGEVLAEAPALGITGQFLDDIQVDFMIQATQADRRSVSLTAPRLTFTNGQTANIYVATQTSFVSDLQPVTSDSAVAFDPTTAVVNDGVVLVIDGVVSADRRYVTLNVDAAISQVRGFDQTEITAAVAGDLSGSGTTGAFIQLPIVSVSRVQTTVTIPDQGTIMLGGQRLVSELQVETGVPVLSKIPILSRFFSNRIDSKEEQTLLILLKPTILIQNEQEEENFPGLLDALGGCGDFRPEIATSGRVPRGARPFSWIGPGYDWDARGDVPRPTGGFLDGFSRIETPDHRTQHGHVCRVHRPQHSRRDERPGDQRGDRGAHRRERQAPDAHQFRERRPPHVGRPGGAHHDPQQGQEQGRGVAARRHRPADLRGLRDHAPHRALQHPRFDGRRAVRVRLRRARPVRMPHMPDTGSTDRFAVELHHERSQIERASEAILDSAQRHGYTKASRFAIRLAFEEAVTNAFHHGHADRPGDPIRVECRVDAEKVWIAVEDRGSGFDPGEVPDPTLDENLSLPSGRGLMLIRTYMSEVRHNERGNRLEMTYRRPGS
jgi:anti-sigma regulatory factor (Ser/Thr protein kinase)/Flp pilus assembly secretin CpaC